MPDDLVTLGAVEVALSPWERFEEYLKIHDKRITQQRRMLVEQVFEAHAHFDADELSARLGLDDDGRKMGRATVYRTLNEMVEAGLLRRFLIAGRSVYEHDYGYPQHDHMHCTACNQLIEFCNVDLVALRDTVAGEQGFLATGHRFIITGKCKKCANKRPK